jgi:hypothetical protein
MARTFRIDTAANPTLLLERVRRVASENGVTLFGNESSGHFSHKMLEGDYRRLGRTVIVTITYKHRLVPWSVLESRLRGLFGSGPSGIPPVHQRSTAGAARRRRVLGGLVSGLHTITGIRIVAGLRTGDESSLTLATTNEELLQAFAVRWNRSSSGTVTRTSRYTPSTSSPSLVHPTRRRASLRSEPIRRSRRLERHATPSRLRPLLPRLS